MVRSVLDEAAAERYIEQIEKVWFYPMAYTIGGPDDTPETWPKGAAKMVALIESIEHSLRFSVNSKPSAGKEMNRVFMVHGRDHGMLRDVEAFVRKIGIDPVILMDEASRNDTVIEKFERFSDVPFAIILFSPDDVGRAYDAPTADEKRRPRQNAVLELGFFIGRLGRENTVLFVDATLTADAEYPSDMGGVVPIYYKPGSDWQMRLMREFKASDIEFDPSKA